jgi:hypothetical protein
LKNIWLIDSSCSRHMIGDRGWFSSLVPVVTRRYITFGDNGRGHVLSEGEIKVSDKITLRRVALVQSLGYNLVSVSQLLDEGFEVWFWPGGSRNLDSRGDLVCMVIPEGQVFRADFSQSSDVERCFLSSSVGDSHEGPLKNRGESCLKPAKNAKRKPSLGPNTKHTHNAIHTVVAPAAL